MSQHLDAEWALAPFLENGLLNKVLSRQSSGKEATVYCCEAGPALGAGRLVAAKIYRSPERRAFKQHADYSNGRYVRGRTARKALKTRNEFGRQMLFEKWVAFEYQALGRLHRAGIPVPEPLAFSGCNMLMEFLGDDWTSAPQLRSVKMSAQDAQAILDEVLEWVEDMLSINLIHGDLSGYNILLWRQQPYFIDVPQALDPRVHPGARDVLLRDLNRICEWAESCGVSVDASTVGAELWERWWQGEL